MSLRDSWGNIVKNIAGSSQNAPKPNGWQRSTVGPISANSTRAPLPNEPAFHGDGRYGGTPNPPNPTPGAAAAEASAAGAEAGTANAANATKASRASAALRWGGRAASAGSRALGAAAMPLVVGKAAFDTAQVPTSSMAQMPDAPSKLRDGSGGATPLLSRQLMGDESENPLLRMAQAPVRSVADSFGALRDGQFLSDLGTRTVNAAASVGNTLTGGLADKVGNYAIGNGFASSTPNAPETGAAPAAAKPGTPAGPPVSAATDSNPHDAQLATNQVRSPGYPGTVARPDQVVPTRNGDGMSIGVGGYMRQLANIRALGDPSDVTPGGAAGVGGSAASLRDRNATVQSILGAGAGNRRERMQAAQLASQQALAADQNAAHMAAAGLQANAQLQATGMNNSTSLRTTGMNNDVTREGNQLSYQGHMAPLQLAAMQRGLHSQVYQSVGAGKEGPNADHHLAAAKTFDSMGLTEQAKAAREAAVQMNTLKGSQENQAQAVKDAAGKAFQGQFMRTDDKGNRVVDHDTATHIGALTERYAPGFSGMAPESRAPVIDHMTALGGLMNNGLGADTKVGWRKLNPFAQTAPGDTLPPDISGAKIERMGNIEGPATLGTSAGNHVITTKDGRQFNLSSMDSTQRKIIDNAIAGKGWAPQPQLR